MDTLLLVGLLAALALTFAGTAVFFARAWTGRREHAEYGVFALLSLSLAFFAAFASLAYYRAEVPGTAPSFTTALSGLVAAGVVTVALLLVFALRYGRVTAWRRISAALALAAAGFLTAVAAGGWWEPLPPELPRVEWLGLSLRSVDFTPRPAAVVFYALVPVVAAATIALVGRSYLRNRRTDRVPEGLTALLGAIALGLAVVNDAAFALGVHRSIGALPLGFAAFVYGVALTLVSRYARTVTVLGERTRELGQRTEELERSYRALDRAESELVRTQQLAVMGELASVVAEKVGAPLAEVDRAVAALHRPAGADTSAVLDAIELQTAHLDRLVRDLLAYARPVTPQAARLGVRELFERSVGPLRAAELAETTPIELVVEVADDATEVLGDPDLLRQALENLVENAVETMQERELGPGEHHRLVLESTRQRGSEAPVVLVRVKDTGAGMSAAERLQARRPFFTTRSAHTGLGLCVVERFVAAHGGKLTLESELGQGTTVTLAMPMARAPRRPHAPPPAA
ncbi:MAG: HAMP domain-containing histidine kinase [Polyangiaceae bacterium]|nr:HAMP domain-containing histidine kinase [Polyangiaceae bacterium]